MRLRPFGTVDGTDIGEVTIGEPDGLQARIITWGAVLRDLTLPVRGGQQHVVLGLDAMAHYIRHSRNFGAVVGRYANRIGGASIRIDGQDVRLAVNEGRNTLHGGPAGFGKRVWTLDEHDARSARLRLVSADGDMGFPGTVIATALYEVLAPATLRVTLEATADRTTPLNLAPHTYFNLDGSADVRGHRLSVRAGHVTPTDGAGIPTGAVRPIAGTPLDYGTARPIRPPAAPYRPLDINYALDGGQGDGLRSAAQLRSDRNGLVLDLWTTEPGLQVYDAAKVDVPAVSHGGLKLQPHCGIALEPQRFPDGPNHASFPPALLRPGEVSRQVTEMRFTPSA